MEIKNYQIFKIQFLNNVKSKMWKVYSMKTLQRTQIYFQSSYNLHRSIYTRVSNRVKNKSTFLCCVSVRTLEIYRKSPLSIPLICYKLL